MSNKRQTDLCKFTCLCLWSSTPPRPPHLTLCQCPSDPLICAEELQGCHYTAFGCLWVTLPHICDRLWAHYPHAFAVSAGCVHMSLTTHWNGAQAIWETCLSCVKSVDKTWEDGVCHTLNWSMWQQPLLCSDCTDQLVALVKHCNVTIIKAGAKKQKPDTPVKQAPKNISWCGQSRVIVSI